MSDEVRDLHYIQYCGMHQLLNPQLGDYARLLPSRLHQILMGHEHGVVLSVIEIKVVVLQSWDLSQLGSNYAYPLRDVRSDQCILKIMWDAVAVNHASQRRYVIWKDRRDLLRVSQIITMLTSLLSCGVSTTRTTSNGRGCLQFPSRRHLYSYRKLSINHYLCKDLPNRYL